MKFGEGDLYDALTAKIEEFRKAKVPRDAWQPRGIPDHLRMHFQIVDDRGKELAQGRDLAELKQRLATKARASFGKLAKSNLDREGVKSWDFGELPERMEIERGGLRLVAYPTLLDEGASVSVRMLDSAETAAIATRKGLRRLFMIQARDELTYQLRLIADLPRLALHYAELGTSEQLKQELVELAAERAFLTESAPVRDKAAFDARLSAGWKKIGPAMKETGEIVRDILGSRHTGRGTTRGKASLAFAPTIADIREQLAHLVPRGFIGGTPYEQLRHLPRYLNAIRIRLEKLQNAGLHRDARWMAEIMPPWRRYVERTAPPGPGEQESKPVDPDLQTYRWMLEEYRVSLFAQELGTAIPVSAKRVEEQWARASLSYLRLRDLVRLSRARAASYLCRVIEDGGCIDFHKRADG
jgi:ATP-dependent helicase HrpA